MDDGSSNNGSNADRYLYACTSHRNIHTGIHSNAYLLTNPIIYGNAFGNSNN
jgi:hypothetical protein